jgi:hypothetical protein
VVLQIAATLSSPAEYRQACENFTQSLPALSFQYQERLFDYVEDSRVGELLARQGLLFFRDRMRFPPPYERFTTDIQHVVEFARDQLTHLCGAVEIANAMTGLVNNLVNASDEGRLFLGRSFWENSSDPCYRLIELFEDLLDGQ